MLHGIERSGFVQKRLNVGFAQRDDLVPGKALGVENGQIVAGDAQSGHALLFQLGDLFFHGGIFLLGDFIDLMDAGTGQNIVELIDEDALPKAVGLVRRIGEQPAGQHGQQLQIHHVQLRLAVGALVPGHRGVGAPVIFEV